MKDYLIDYELIKDNIKIKSGTFKVRNCLSELGAKIKFEPYIKRKYIFDKLIITKCIESNCVTDLFATFK